MARSALLGSSVIARAALLAVVLAGMALPAAAADRYALIVSGANGDDAYGAQSRSGVRL